MFTELFPIVVPFAKVQQESLWRQRSWKFNSLIVFESFTAFPINITLILYFLLKNVIQHPIILSLKPRVLLTLRMGEFNCLALSCKFEKYFRRQNSQFFQYPGLYLSFIVKHKTLTAENQIYPNRNIPCGKATVPWRQSET